MPPLYQVVIGLRYLATNSFQIVCGDTIHIDQATACCAVHRFLTSFVKHVNQFIKFPRNQEALNTIKDEFYHVSNFPIVVGLVDGTHVKLIPPSKDKEAYKNRKGLYSINVQCICDRKGEFLQVYANWPGSAHDSRVFRESIMVSTLSSAWDIILFHIFALDTLSVSRGVPYSLGP